MPDWQLTSRLAVKLRRVRENRDSDHQSVIRLYAMLIKGLSGHIRSKMMSISGNTEDLRPHRSCA